MKSKMSSRWFFKCILSFYKRFCIPIVTIILFFLILEIVILANEWLHKDMNLRLCCAPAALPSPRPKQQLMVSAQPQGRLNMSPQHCYLPWHHLAMAISMDIAPRRKQARLNRLWSRVLKWNGHAPFFFLLHLWFPGER